MPPKVEIPADELVALIEKYTGNVAAIAREKKCDRDTVQARINETKSAQKALETARETFVDHVESALYGNALAGNVTAQIFVLKAHPMARKRGWSERNEHELSGAGGGPVQIEIEVVYVDKNKD